jgi:hypothetical protein
LKGAQFTSCGRSYFHITASATYYYQPRVIRLLKIDY